MEIKNHSRIIVIGIGPGSAGDITSAALDALRRCDVVVGYHGYFQYIKPYLSEGVPCVDSGMKREKERAEKAFDLAEEGKTVCVISSGDAGIYGMAPLVLEMKHQRRSAVIVEVIPGVSAFQKAAALLGSPVGHDFCVISLSDLMTPWALIERRIVAAAEADFVTAVYNPKSEGRYWQLYRLKELFLQSRSPQTPVGFVHQAGRDGEEVVVTALQAFDPEQTDMFTVVLIGNSQSFVSDGTFITPRGYYREEEHEEGVGIGQEIMMESFRTIEGELKRKDIALDRKWALLHAIHTTADFDMERVLWMDEGAVARLYETLSSGHVKTIVCLLYTSDAADEL